MGLGQYKVRKNWIQSQHFSFSLLTLANKYDKWTIFHAHARSHLHRYSRLLSPRYGDGYSLPTVSITGRELPNSRLVSLVAFGEADVPDPQFTLVNMQIGQIITHDMSMLAGSTQSSTFHIPIRNNFACYFSSCIDFDSSHLLRKTCNTMLHRRWSIDNNKPA